MGLGESVKGWSPLELNMIHHPSLRYISVIRVFFSYALARLVVDCRPGNPVLNLNNSLTMHMKPENRKYDNKYAQQLQADYASLMPDSRNRT